ncbi:serine hydrolase domain-containing protein [Maribacter polysaccharolyticus]|uniref:serine hydrolase domain-containing protein n=1 Tax=Maribacter polysaccharolyticus TaxID=3020831 RepID=UPI00237F3430|nr:serine hydrolase domain-containing protein [Maribacter polysaccharolyticus]MDE3741274.1 serine hydrolase [Maribacter polysaccharolyticus]
MKYIAVLGLLFIFSCKLSGEKETVSNTGDWSDLETQLDSLFESNFQADDPGVAVLVSYDGHKIFAKGYGVGDLDAQKPLTASSNMELASVSKQFTALAILSLVDRQKLSLSDTLFKFLPYETFKNVTIQELIDHTSGLDDAEEYFYDHWDTTKIATNKDVLHWYLEKNKKVGSADKVFKYNNGAYELLPLVVEKVSGEKYPDYIRQNVFGKAGMTKTVAYDLNNPVDIEQRAFYYHKDSLGDWKKMDGHPLTGLFGAGGIYTSLNDYFNYDNALREKSIFNEKAHGLIFKPTSSELVNGVKNDYAMGWFVTDTLAEHSGGWFGVNTFTRRYLNMPLTLAIFANRDDFFDKELIDITDSIVKSQLKRNKAR